VKAKKTCPHASKRCRVTCGSNSTKSGRTLETGSTLPSWLVLTYVWRLKESRSGLWSSAQVQDLLTLARTCYNSTWISSPRNSKSWSCLVFTIRLSKLACSTRDRSCALWACWAWKTSRKLNVSRSWAISLRRKQLMSIDLTFWEWLKKWVCLITSVLQCLQANLLLLPTLVCLSNSWWNLLSIIYQRNLSQSRKSLLKLSKPTQTTLTKLLIVWTRQSRTTTRDSKSWRPQFYKAVLFSTSRSIPQSATCSFAKDSWCSSVWSSKRIP